MLKKIKEFLKEKGQGVVEYALLLGFIAIIALFLFDSSGLSGTVKDSFTGVHNEVTQMNDVISSNTNKITVPASSS